MEGVLILAGLPVYPDARRYPGGSSWWLRTEDGRPTSYHVTPEVYLILIGQREG